MLNEIAYQVGRAFGSLSGVSRVVVVACIAVAVGYLVTRPLHDGRATTAADAAELSQLAASQAQAVASSKAANAADPCRSTIDAKRAEYQTLVAARKYWDASLTLRVCSETLNDPALRAMVADAEIRSHLATINDPKAPPRERAHAIEMLTRDCPETGKPFAQLQTQLISKADSTERAQEAARRNSEGVSIGMTRQGAVASSWGRPEHVNKTTTASGTREPWIYGPRRSLCFDDGVLTGIQN